MNRLRLGGLEKAALLIAAIIVGVTFLGIYMFNLGNRNQVTSEGEKMEKIK